MIASKWSPYLLSLASLAVMVSAQAPAWGQCGGIGWTGETTCEEDATCTRINDWYFECVPDDSPLPPQPPPAADPDANYWISFGDSYTQTGFEITQPLPNKGNPIGNPDYPGWTATGGEQWLDYDTTHYNKSLTLTYNFAYGGATIDSNLVTPFEPYVKSMTDQVTQFLDWNEGGGSVVWKSENTLFSVWIGINDIGNSYYLEGDRDAFSDTLLDAEFALVEKLMVNTYPTAAPLEAQVIAGFNSRLASRIASFESSHDGVKTYLYDSYAGFAKILDDPTAYGFRDNLTYGTDSDLFWGNDYHPSTYAHKYFGQDVAEVLADSIW